jgi:hypothetical protein
MKIRTQRMSGLPVDPASAKLFEDEFKVGYDDALSRHAKSRNEDGTVNFKSIDMLSVQEDIAKLEAALKLKYKVEGEVQMPKNAKQWNALIQVYQAPLLVANSSERPEELVIVIFDTPLS